MINPNLRSFSLKDDSSYHIREYKPEDESGWLRCRVLAFLDTSYFDDVYPKKERYESPAIELVAESDGIIVGLIDVECEEKPGSICSPSNSLDDHLAGMIWHLAVHPDYRRIGIATGLIDEAVRRARDIDIERFEAWTRDDVITRKWYGSQGFKLVQSYYHVYLKLSDMETAGICSNSELKPYKVFAHYLGEDREFLSQFSRVHECVRFDLILNSIGK
ncbi:MAG: GNAT family N-acetyltransferase [Candidatus Lokiarchaeota archaeon]|nr:GNAT family N-acetyltransferase [Candidatus Lokiarchaeota archaeon]